jgi:hypothetical protein
MKTLKVFKFIGFGLLGLGAIGLFVFITMLLWNGLIPLLFHGPVVTYWQTAGLIILSKIIFSGFGHGGGHHGSRRYANRCADDHRQNRVDWWKRFDEMKKENNSSAPVE